MKRKLVFCLLLTVACVCVFFLNGAALAGGFAFTFEPNGEGTAVITGVCGVMDSDLSIGEKASFNVPKKIQFPSEICGYTVNEISLYTFRSEGDITGSPMTRSRLEETRQITLPDTLVRIDRSSFAHCDALTSITIPEGVVEIDDYAFYNCENLKSVSLPSTLRRIGKQAFGSCEKLTAIHFPEGLEEIGDEAFQNCRALETVEGLGENVHLGSEVFQLTPVREQFIQRYDQITDQKAQTDPDLKIRIEADVGNRYFEVPKWLTEDLKTAYPVYQSKDQKYQYIRFTDDTCAIMDTNFGEKAKGTLKIPAKIDGYTVIAVLGSGNNSQYDALEIPEGVRYIGQYGFANWSIKKVKLPESLEKIDPKAFYNDNYLIFTEEQKERFPEADPLGIPCLYRVMPDGTARITKWKNIRAKTAEVPESIDGHKVVSIGTEAFIYCDFETVTLPDSIRSIGYQAFYRCDNLKSITLPESLEYISREAFVYCKSLTSVTFPAKLKFLGEDAFRGVPLKEAILPEGLDYLGSYAFWNGGQCEKAFVPASVTHFGGYVFQGQSRLKDVTFADGLQTIGEAAFASTGITKVTLPASLRKIGGGAFAYCESLQTVETGGCEEIGDQAFAFCPKLKSVVFGDNLKKIDEAAFLDHGMKEIRLPASLVRIGDSALYPMKNKNPLKITVTGAMPDSLAYSLLAGTAVPGVIKWPLKLTVELSAEAAEKTDNVREVMKVFGITEKEWKLVDIQP